MTRTPPSRRAGTFPDEKVQLAVILGLAALLSACAQKVPGASARNAKHETAPAPGRSTVPPAALPAASAAPAVCHGFPIALPPSEPTLVDYFAAAPEVFDWQSLYLFHPQPAVNGFKGFGAPLKGAFPGRKFRHVYFHHFGDDRRYPEAPVLDSTVAGCQDVLLASDGRYCPSVSHPPIELSVEQVMELLSITNEHEEFPKVKASGLRKTCGFVFVDDQGLPVAEMAVGLYSGKVATFPSNDELRKGDWNGARWKRLLALVGALEPRLIATRTLNERLMEQAYADEQASSVETFLRVGDARYLPAYSSIEPELREADLSKQQRAIACAWQQLVWLAGAPRSGPESASIECDDGWKPKSFDLLSCQREFPRCEATVGEVEQCMRQQRFDPCLEAPPAHQCRALRDCFWGMTSGSSAH